jgi:hypothetical protein
MAGKLLGCCRHQHCQQEKRLRRSAPQTPGCALDCGCCAAMVGAVGGATETSRTQLSYLTGRIGKLDPIWRGRDQVADRSAAGAADASSSRSQHWLVPWAALRGGRVVFAVHLDKSLLVDCAPCGFPLHYSRTTCCPSAFLSNPNTCVARIDGSTPA